MAVWIRERVCEFEGEEDWKDEERGFVIVGEESEELLSLSEEEPPPKKPPPPNNWLNRS